MLAADDEFFVCNGLVDGPGCGAFEQAVQFVYWGEFNVRIR
jgi:hypothetical protein